MTNKGMDAIDVSALLAEAERTERQMRTSAEAVTDLLAEVERLTKAHAKALAELRERSGCNNCRWQFALDAPCGECMTKEARFTKWEWHGAKETDEEETR